VYHSAVAGTTITHRKVLRYSGCLTTTLIYYWWGRTNMSKLFGQCKSNGT